MIFTLQDFIRESNRIERILREPTDAEIEAHELFLALPTPTVPDLERFVAVVAPGKLLRRETGMDVRVGSHIAPPGGPEIEPALAELLVRAGHGDPYAIHREYQTLHPFMDGNGRSGRVLWLRMMDEIAPLGFLHHWYYQSLGAAR